jgi:hypothetical protein
MQTQAPAAPALGLIAQGEQAPAWSGQRIPAALYHTGRVFIPGESSGFGDTLVPHPQTTAQALTAEAYNQLTPGNALALTGLGKLFQLGGRAATAAKAAVSAYLASEAAKSYGEARGVETANVPTAPGKSETQFALENLPAGGWNMADKFMGGLVEEGRQKQQVPSTYDITPEERARLQASEILSFGQALGMTASLKTPMKLPEGWTAPPEALSREDVSPNLTPLDRWEQEHGREARVMGLLPAPKERVQAPVERYGEGFLVNPQGQAISNLEGAGPRYEVAKEPYIGPERQLTTPEAPIETKPAVRQAGPFIAGATNVKGETAPVQPTREMTELHSGIKPTKEQLEHLERIGALMPYQKQELQQMREDFAPKMQPALLVDGQALTGGKTHKEIYEKLRAEQPDNAGLHEAMINDAQHVFVDDKGKVYNRAEAGKAVGYGAPLHSEVLQRLQQKDPMIRLHSGVPIDWDKFKEAVGASGMFMHGAVKAMASQEGTGVKNPNVELDSQQLWNRVKNKMGGQNSEVKMWEDLGVQKFVQEHPKTTPVEMAKWMTENGPKVEVRSYGAEGKVSEAASRLGLIEHAWLDNLNHEQRNALDDALRDDSTSYTGELNKKELQKHGWSDIQIAQAEEYVKARNEVNAHSRKGIKESGMTGQQVGAYKSVSPKSTEEPMPEWTTSAREANGDNQYTVKYALKGWGIRKEVVKANSPEEAAAKIKQEYGERAEVTNIDSPERTRQLARLNAQNSYEAELTQYEKDMREWKTAKRKAEAAGKEYDEEEPQKPDISAPTETTRKNNAPKNVQRVDVVLPENISQKDYLKKQGYSDEQATRIAQEGKQNKNVLWQPDSLHEQHPNTLGWAAIQYETGKNGEKIAHIFEVQSRWGQAMRRSKELDREQSSWTPENYKEKDHPLLRDYNRLILKAAIEQARKEGATHIAISDAETAMMSEGHDAHSMHSMTLSKKAPAKVIEDVANENYIERYGIDPKIKLEGKDLVASNGQIVYPEVLNDEGYMTYAGMASPTMRREIQTEVAKRIGAEQIMTGKVEQEPGMRLNYDKILPNIASELTGSKGEKVSLGEHKNAYELQTNQVGNQYEAPRQNLIFRNPDGTPKTDASAMMYPLGKLGEQIARGEPVTPMQKLHSGIPLPSTKDIERITKDVATFITNRPKREAIAALKDATSSLVSKNANENASTISGMLQRATGSGEALKQNSVVRNALSFIVESEGDVNKLKEFRTKIEAAPAEVKQDRANALLALNYAEKNFNNLKPVADRYSEITEKEANMEESAGRKIVRRKGYVMHLAEDKGDASSFTHAREYDTFADRIKAGVPVGSLDSVELLRSRTARGQQIYVQAKTFIDNVRRMKDNTGKNIIADYDKVPRGPGLPDDYVVPKGYQEVQVGYNKMPVREGFADTLQALTSPSWFMQRPLGRGLLEFRGVGKHIVLGFDTFHLGRLATYGVAAKLGTGNVPTLAFKKGVTILDNTPEELTAKAKAGQINPKDLPEMLDAKRKIDLGIRTGFNVSRVVDAFNQHWTEHIPVSGTFQNWLFNTFQRGVMADVYVKAFDTYKKQMPGKSESEVARQLSKDLNDVFGTRGRQGWVRSRTGQDIMSMFFLAPQWTEGRIMTEGKALTGSAKALGDITRLRKPEVNMQARVVGSIVLMYLVGNQVINMATTGHSTFENEQGHELDAYIPDVMSGSQGYWLNPTANAAEVIHTMNNSLEREGGDAWQAWLDFVGGRLSTVARPAAVSVTGKQYGITGPDVPPLEGEKKVYGRPSGEAKLVAGLKNVIQPPIGSAELGEALTGKATPATEKQMLSRVGLKVDYAGQPAKKKKSRYTIIK